MSESKQEQFEKACKEPVILGECYAALQCLIDGRHSLHVPPMIDDADIILSRALRELKEFRAMSESIIDVCDVCREVKPLCTCKPSGEHNKIVKFSLSYCGVEESEEMDCTGMSQDEIDKELVNWVLDRVDHWSEVLKGSERE
jgi:hypothetical protein